nr:GRB2-associated-binding protein 2-like [Dasypus novemcinctus]
MWTVPIRGTKPLAPARCAPAAAADSAARALVPVACGLPEAGTMSGGGDVVCTGWLRKSPPEKKLRRYAWKKRWFILRSGWMSSDPDVLEYYENDHSKMPLHVINLSFCEQVDAGLTFNKKELQDSFVFDIKTSEHTFYLVAETEEDMNKWVQSICQICGFHQAKESTDSLRNISSASHGPRSSPAEVSISNRHLLRERKSSAPSHSSRPRQEKIPPQLPIFWNLVQLFFIWPQNNSKW